MPASLKIKFEKEGIEIGEVLQYTKQCGRLAAMERYGTKDWISFDKFIRETGGSPTLGIGVTNSQGSPDLLSQAIELFSNKLTQVIAQNQAIIERQAQEIARLKSQLSLLDDRDTGRAVEALARLKALSI